MYNQSSIAFTLLPSSMLDRPGFEPKLFSEREQSLLQARHSFSEDFEAHIVWHIGPKYRKDTKVTA